MIVKWREGKWDGDDPISPTLYTDELPETEEHVWYFIDTKYGRIDSCPSYSFSLIARTALVYQRVEEDQKGKGKAAPPRWWWVPLEAPTNFPEDSIRWQRLND